MEIQRKEKLEKYISFRVKAVTAEDYNFIRSKNYELQEALRKHAEKLIAKLKLQILKSER